MATLIVSLACAGGLSSASAAAAETGCANADALPSVVDTATLSTATLCLLNEQRATAGLPPLTANHKLEVAANGYSNAMVRDGFFAHVSPSGQTLEDRLGAVSYTGRGRGWFIGENIGWATGQNSTPRGMVNAWMNSEGHRHNIMDGGFKEIGVGIVTGTPVGAAAVSKATYTTEFGTRSGETAFAARSKELAAEKVKREAKKAKRAAEKAKREAKRAKREAKTAKREARKSTH